MSTYSQQVEPQFSLKQIKILEKLKMSGLDAHDLRIVLSPGDMAEVNLVYKSKNIGYGSLDAVENQQNPGRIHFNFISIQERYIGKGFGLLMYLALAKAAYMSGRILESSYDLNLNSLRVWEQLTVTGLAKKMKSGHYEFKFEVLSSNQFQTAVDYLLGQFSLRPGESLLVTGNLE